jgi:tetraacyldisaccharide 4'-kinase
MVSDEALLLARYAPLVIGRHRDAAVTQLLAETRCDVVISDDGLQHYALARDVEVVVMEAAYGTGNGLWLPAGPLREPLSRLREVDYVLTVGGDDPAHARRCYGDFVHLETGETQPAEHFHGMLCSAVAGIGHPEQFFKKMQELGLETENYGYPDHHAYSAEDLARLDTALILMTEKDAVKCRAFGDARVWYLPMSLVLPEAFKVMLLEKLRKKIG